MVWAELGSAIVGGIIVAASRPFLSFVTRPRLEISYERYLGKFPYIHSLNLLSVETSRLSLQGVTLQPGLQSLFLRLWVKNKGITTARNCRAAVVVYPSNYEVLDEFEKRLPWSGPLHWAVRDPAVFKELSAHYSGIDISSKVRGESLDVLVLPKIAEKHYEDDERPGEQQIETVSYRVALLKPNLDYNLVVTLWSDNASAKLFGFKLNWDGTVPNMQNGEFIKCRLSRKDIERIQNEVIKDPAPSIRRQTKPLPRVIGILKGIRIRNPLISRRR